jgi:hypothetical protein
MISPPITAAPAATAIGESNMPPPVAGAAPPLRLLFLMTGASRGVCCPFDMAEVPDSSLMLTSPFRAIILTFPSASLTSNSVPE